MANPSLLIKIKAVDEASAALGKARKSIEAISAPAKQATNNLDALTSKIESIKNQFIGLFIVAPKMLEMVKGFGRLAEASKTIAARLKIATDSTADFNRASEKTKQIALATGTSLEGVAGLYSKLRVNAGLAAGEAEQLTEVISKASQLDGGGEGAQAAIFQLQQGLASGTLRGEELNSVMEQTPSIAKAIADGLRLDIGELRAVAAAGELTTERVKTALLSMKGQIDNNFGQLPVTTGRAFENLRTKAIGVFGSLDQDLNLTGSFAGLVQGVGDNLRAVVGLTVAATGAITAAWLTGIAQRRAAERAAHVAKLQELVEAKTAELASAKSLPVGAVRGAAVNAAAAEVVAAKAAMEAAQKPTSILSGLVANLGRAFGLLLSPIGLAITAIGALAGYYAANQNETFKLGDTTAKLSEIVGAAWKTIKDTIGGAIAAVARAMGVSGDSIGETLANVADSAKSAFSGVLSAINEVISRAVSGFTLIGKAAGIAFAKIQSVFSGNGLGESFADSMQSAIDEETKFLESGGIGGAWQAAIEKNIKEARDKAASDAKAFDDQKKKQADDAAAARAGGPSIEIKDKDAESAAKKAEKEAQDKLEAEKKLQRELSEIRAQTLEAEGKSVEARKLELETQYADLIERLKAKGDQAGIDLVNKLINTELAKAKTDELEDQVSKITDKISRVDTQIRNAEQSADSRVQTGDITAPQARVEISAVRDEAIVSLRQYREELAQLAEKDAPGAKDALAALDVQLADIAAQNATGAARAIAELRDEADQLNENFSGDVIRAGTDSIRSAIGDLVTGTTSVSEAFRNMGASFFQTLAKMSADALAADLMSKVFDKAKVATDLEGTKGLFSGFTGFLQNIFGIQVAQQQAASTQIVAAKTQEATAAVSANAATAASGAAASQAPIPFVGPGLAIAAFATIMALVMGAMGKIKGFATGGLISGPGTGTSDSIPAWLSSGEYVIKADAVRRYGVNFFDSLNGAAARPPFYRARFATGGLVPSAPAPAAAPQQSIRIVNTYDPSLARDYLESAAGERVILNALQRNAGSVKQILR